MICDKCGKEVYHLIFIYKDNLLVSGCKICLKDLFTGRQITRAVDKSAGSPAHIDDIRKRKLDPKTGQVYRDYGKKYFTCNYSKP